MHVPNPLEVFLLSLSDTDAFSVLTSASETLILPFDDGIVDDRRRPSSWLPGLDDADG